MGMIVMGLVAVLLVIVVFVYWRKSSEVVRATKVRREPPPPPPKDWQGIAERLEKKLKSLDETLQVERSSLKEKEKRIEELNGLLAVGKKQLEQEKVWRAKEEAKAARDKKLEREFQAELTTAREMLHAAASERIKWDAEFKEVRQNLEESGLKVRSLSSSVMELERQLAASVVESRRLDDENKLLSRKKKAEKWVAIDDYRKLNELYKRAYWEIEQFKRKVPVKFWPTALKPKGTAVPAEAGAGEPEAVAGPVAGSPEIAPVSSGSSVSSLAEQKNVVMHDLPPRASAETPIV